MQQKFFVFFSRSETVNKNPFGKKLFEKSVAEGLF